jgi:predicted Zn-dependent peptidase
MAKQVTLLLSAFLLFSGIVHAESSYDLKDKVRAYTLSNGLRILMLERHLSPTVSCYIRYRAGASDDEGGKTGMAHFLEHMMFKGTETIGTKDFSKEKPVLLEIEKIGISLDDEMMKAEKADRKRIAELRQKLKSLQKEEEQWIIENEVNQLYMQQGAINFNANTSQDMTTYHVSLPSSKLELWARIESDRMIHLVFREFYTERDVIMEERRQSIESNPDGKLYEQFLATAFNAHPYGRPVIGWPSDMRFLDMTSMQVFLRHYYAPNNTVIAIVGDIKPDESLKLMEKYFGSVTRLDTKPHHITQEPIQHGERRVSLLFDSRPQIILGYHKPSPPSKDDYVFDAIEAILTKSRTSRMYKSIVEEKGLVENIRAMNGVPGGRFPNLFVVWATSRGNHMIEEIEKAIQTELDRFKVELVSRRELDQAVNRMKADFIRSLRTNEGMAENLSYFEALLGDYQYLTRYLDNMGKITPEEIQKAAIEYFKPENRTVAVILGAAGDHGK